MTEPAESFTIRTPEQLRAVSDPLRQRLMGAFAEPATVKQAAAKLGVPLGRLYHHVDQLEAAGLIRVVSERKRRATVERTFQAVARRLAVAASAIGGDGPAAAGAAMARAAVEELLARLPAAPPSDGAMHIAQGSARLTPEGLARLEAELGAFLRRFEDPDGRETRILWMAAPSAE
jgi:DNA-binding transcriptional ArsR family regulator